MINKKDISKLEGLVYLYALSKTKSKREVAEQMGTSVDTLNKYIVDLEAECKSRFFMSSGRGTSITPEGRRVLKISSSIINALKSIDEYGNRASMTSGIVRLGLSDALSEFLDVASMVPFFDKYPNIHIESVIGNSLREMQSLETDIALGYDAPEGDDLVLICRHSVKCGLFASQKYIDTYGMPKNITDLVENHRLCDMINHKTYAEGWGGILDKAKHLVYRSNSIYSFRRAVECGVGIGMCPFYYGDKKLVRIKNTGIKYDVAIYMVAHKDTKDMPRIRVTLDYLHNLLKKKLN